VLQPKIIRDLKLYEHGLRVVERRVQNFLPLPDERYLLTGADRTEHEIAKFSAEDAARYPAYRSDIIRVVAVLRDLALVAPANLVTGDLSGTVRGLAKFAAIGKRLWQANSLRVAVQLLRRSAGEMLDTWFESDPIKAVLGFDAVVGNLASPYTAGSAYVLLHHALGELNGKSSNAIGGMGAITQAMARVAVKHGARIDVGSEIREVIVEGDRAVGVVLQDGRSVRAPRGDCECQSTISVPKPSAT
jgi:phytoene dehydrogenase-like protein